jgi:hypothetical protein
LKANGEIELTPEDVECGENFVMKTIEYDLYVDMIAMIGFLWMIPHLD